MSMEQTVYVVDDDPPVLKAVSRLLRSAGFQVATFSSSQRFLDEHHPSTPGCVVMDMAMPGLSGLELQRMLASKGNGLPVIFLSGRSDIPATVKAMKQGATDFLTKPIERDELLRAVRSALTRDQAMRLAQREVDEIRGRLATLTPREYEVFEYVISGKLNKQTAADLGTAEKTIKVHRSRVMEKMNVQSVAELVRLAERAGIRASANIAVDQISSRPA